MCVTFYVYFYSFRDRIVQYFFFSVRPVLCSQSLGTIGKKQRLEKILSGKEFSGILLLHLILVK